MDILYLKSCLKLLKIYNKQQLEEEEFAKVIEQILSKHLLELGYENIVITIITCLLNPIDIQQFIYYSFLA